MLRWEKFKIYCKLLEVHRFTQEKNYGFQICEKLLRQQTSHGWI